MLTRNLKVGEFFWLPFPGGVGLAEVLGFEPIPADSYVEAARGQPGMRVRYRYGMENKEAVVYRDVTKLREDITHATEAEAVAERLAGRW